MDRDDPEAQDLVQTVQKDLNRKRSVSGKSLEKVQQFLSAGDDFCAKKQFRKAVSYYSKVNKAVIKRYHYFVSSTMPSYKYIKTTYLCLRKTA
jgi:hypothetical protein